MKIKILVAIFVLGCFVCNQSVACNDMNIEYGDGGGVTVKNYNGEVVGTYENIDDMFLQMFGYIPEMQLSESSMTPPSNHNTTSSSSSNKQRGRLIYTVKEAESLSKPTGNKFRIRYK